MIYITNESTNPQYNLALEEYVFKNLDSEGDCIILWQNRPSIIIGRHQNTLEEINMDYVNEKNIFVVRRLSGGGAVYHDLGNINFTFIVRNKKDSLYDFRGFTKPVVDALRKMGVNAEFNSRNDITIDGKKISGNAQYVYKDKILHHGTLLFNSDLTVLQNALKVSKDKIESKGIKSVRSRVTNISEYLPEPITAVEFKSKLLESLIENQEDIREYVFSQEELNKVEKLKEERYSTWEWNFGESPSFNFKNSKRFEGGKVEVLLEVKRGGIIENCKIYGDFLGGDDITFIEESIKNVRHEHGAIKSVLSKFDIPRYFGCITMEELLSCFF